MIDAVSRALDHIMSHRLFAFVAALVLLTGPVRAQINYNHIMNQARTAGSAPANGGLPPSPAMSAPTPENPALAATQQNIANLANDLASLVSADPAHLDDSVKLPLLNDLAAAAQGTKPSKESLQKIADALATALAGHSKLGEPQRALLGRWLHALANSSHLTPAQKTLLTTSAHKMLTQVGVPADTTDAVMVALQDLASQTQ